MSSAIEERAYSLRRACYFVVIDTKVFCYLSCRSGDSIFKSRVHKLSAIRHRFGCRRLYLLLQREGFAVNHKTIYYIYAEEKLKTRERGGRERALRTRSPMTLPQDAYQSSSLILSRMFWWMAGVY